MALILTPEQIEKIKKLIAKRHAAVIAKVVGADALTKEEKALLAAAGIPIAEGLGAIRSSYLYGQLIGRLAEAKHPETITLPEFKQLIEESPIPLSVPEKAAVVAAERSAGNYIRNLGSKIDMQTGQAILQEDAQLRAEVIAGVREQVSGNITKRESIQKLKSSLGHMQEDWNRDWNRVAVTEKQNAMQQGVADALKVGHGGDVYVYKRTMPAACKHCVRLHIGSDGAPRIFKLSALTANGSNVGRKAADWLAVVGPIHPHCRCSLHRVPPGFGFDEGGVLVPGGKLGERYDSEAAIELSLRAKDSLVKALPRVDFQGLRVRVEQHPGDIRTWTDHDGRTGRTTMRYPYGFIEDTRGADGDEYDCFLGPDPSAQMVFIVHQQNPTTGEYDEDKALLGFPDIHWARAAYLIHYDTPEFYGALSAVPFDEFKAKVLRTTQPSEDGMVKSKLRLVIPFQKAGLAPEIAGATSIMGDRAVLSGSGGLNHKLKVPFHKPDRKAADPIDLEALAERPEGQIEKDVEDYGRPDTGRREITYTLQQPEHRAETMDAAHEHMPIVRADLQRRLDGRGGVKSATKDVAIDSPKFFIRLEKAHSPGSGPEQANHLYTHREWMKDHWVYEYAKKHGGKIVGHYSDAGQVVIKVPLDKFETLQKFAKEHGLGEPFKGGQNAMLPLTEAQAHAMRALAAAKPPKAPKVMAAPSPAPTGRQGTWTSVKSEDLQLPSGIAPKLAQRGEKVHVKIGKEQHEGEVLGFDHKGNTAVLVKGKRRTVKWHAVTRLEAVPYKPAHRDLPEGAIVKATERHKALIARALDIQVVGHHRAHEFASWMHTHGAEAYIVGGVVRDMIAGTKPGSSATDDEVFSKMKDVDLSVTAPSGMIKQMLHEVAGDLKDKHGQQLDPVKGGWPNGSLVLAGGPTISKLNPEGLDIASMVAEARGTDEKRSFFFPRNELKQGLHVQDDGEHAFPLTFDHSLHDDVCRRDFTMNALYYDPLNHTILDPSGHGIADAQSKQLRFVGNDTENANNPGLHGRFWKFRLRGFEADAETKAKIRAIAQHRFENTKMEDTAYDFAKFCGKACNDPKKYLADLRKVMEQDGCGDLYDKHLAPIEHLVVLSSKKQMEAHV